SIDPKADELRATYAQTLFALGRKPEAWDELRLGLSVNPPNPKILLTATRLNIVSRNFAAAHDLIQRGLENTPENRSEFVALARTLGVSAFASRRPSLKVAKEAFDLVTHDPPRDAKASLPRGRIQLDAANPASIRQAVADLVTARDLRQDSSILELSVVGV